MKSRILWRLFMAFSVIIGLSFFALYVYLVPNLRSFLIQDTESELKEKAFLVRHLLKDIPKGSWDYQQLDQLADELGSQLESRITIITADGRVLGDSSVPLAALPQIENHLQRPEVQDSLHKAFGMRIRYSTTVNTDMMYVAVAVSGGFARVSLPLRVIKKAETAVKRSVILAIIVAFALAALLGFLISRRASRAVSEMVSVAQQISAGDLSQRLVPQSRDEFGTLAKSINEMAANLEAQRASLLSEKNQLQAVLDSMIEGVLVTDEKGEITMVNPALIKIFELEISPEGKSIVESLRNTELYESVQRTLEEKRPQVRELQLFVGTQERFLNVQTAPLMSLETIVGSVSVLEDVTEMRRLENVRKEFVANVSHELKTPLTSIRGFAETLSNGALDDASTAKRFVAKIESNAAQLQNLIEDILDISEIESGRRDLTLLSVKLRDVIEAVLGDFQERFEKKQLQTQIDVPADQVIKADPAALRQILSNLIDNAIKYTEEKGSIRIYSTLTDDGFCEVSVKDSGLGIPKEDLPHIFERFYRVDKARSRALGGTGLGLSIVKHLVQGQGGQVDAESQLGSGSRFSFTLGLG